jgi:hypothetical protein
MFDGEQLSMERPMVSLGSGNEVEWPFGPLAKDERRMFVHYGEMSR